MYHSILGHTCGHCYGCEGLTKVIGYRLKDWIENILKNFVNPLSAVGHYTVHGNFTFL